MADLLVLLSFFVASVIGALPLGLVNVTVFNVASHSGVKNSMEVAKGATVVEVLYVLLALIIVPQFGGVAESITVKTITVIALVLVGSFFFFKRTEVKVRNEKNVKLWINGALLNLVSVQVFGFWLLAVAFMLSVFDVHVSPYTFLFAMAAAVIGKMGVLWGYAYLSKSKFAQSPLIHENINRVVGGILLSSSLVQLVQL